MKNNHKQSIPDEILAQVVAKLNEVNALINPFAITLTAADRKDMLKMGEKSISFVEKALELSKSNAEFIPSYLNVVDFEIDLKDAKNLLVAENISEQIYNAINDTIMVAGSEAYYAALCYYNSVQLAANMNTQGAKAVNDELKKKFPGKTKKTTPENE